MIINTRKKDVVWNYLGISTSLGSQIILLPILIKYLEPDILGLWYIFVSIGSLVVLFDFGLNPTIARTVAYSWSGAKSLNRQDVDYIDEKSETNYELLFYIIKTCRLVYLLISLLALLTMLIIGTWYIKNISKDIFSYNILIAWFVYIVSIFFNLYVGYYAVALRGIGDIANLNKINVIAKLSFLIIGLLGLILGYGILALSLANLISGFILRCLSAYVFYNKHKIKDIFASIVFKHRYSVKYVFRKMWYNTWRDGIVSINVYLTTQANTLLCASFLSLQETGIYSFCLQVVSALYNISSGLYVSSQPSLQSAYINNDKNLSRKLFSMSIFVFYLVFILGTLIFIILGIPIILYIKNAFNIDKLMFLLLAINMLLIQRHRLSASFISNMNRLPYVKAFISFGFLSLILSYICMKFLGWGVYSLIIGSIIIQSIYNNWKWNLMVNKYLGINEFELVKLGYNEIKSKLYNKK